MKILTNAVDSILELKAFILKEIPTEDKDLKTLQNNAYEAVKELYNKDIDLVPAVLKPLGLPQVVLSMLAACAEKDELKKLAKVIRNLNATGSSVEKEDDVDEKQPLLELFYTLLAIYKNLKLASTRTLEFLLDAAKKLGIADIANKIQAELDRRNAKREKEENEDCPTL